MDLWYGVSDPRCSILYVQNSIINVQNHGLLHPTPSQSDYSESAGEMSEYRDSLLLAFEGFTSCGFRMLGISGAKGPYTIESSCQLHMPTFT